MRRALRILLNSATAISALLCVTMVALWCRSYFYSETLHWYGDGREFSLMSHRGHFTCYHVASADIANPTRFNHYKVASPRELDSRARSLSETPGIRHVGATLGFAAWYHPKPDYADRFVEVWIPWWFLTLTCATVPARWLKRWASRRHPRDPGACPACGYDRRATPDRCPECGTVPKPS